jgi:hypothetical protein
VAGLGVGGATCNATVPDAAGTFLVDRLVETPSRVSVGSAVAITVLAGEFARALDLCGTPRTVAVGLDTRQSRCAITSSGHASDSVARRTGDQVRLLVDSRGNMVTCRWRSSSPCSASVRFIIAAP